MMTFRPSSWCLAIRPFANPGTSSISRSAASWPASWTSVRSHPDAARAIWRVASIDGMVSPTTSKNLKTSPSPGMLRSGSSPTRFSIVLNIGPLAPVSRVRSRSKNAASSMERAYVPTSRRSPGAS